MKKEERSPESETTTASGAAVSPLTPSCWAAVWDSAELNTIFNVPPLSPLSPHPARGYSHPWFCKTRGDNGSCRVGFVSVR